MSKKGILLVNLGTPDSPETKDVRTYLSEFLNDPRVIDYPALLRILLVNGIIVPFRAPKSAATYKKIWTKEGSPLMVWGKKVHALLQKKLGEEYVVEFAMRYRTPSIEQAIENLKKADVDSIKVIPLFPHYASATTGSVHQKIMEIVSKWQIVPEISFVNSFYDDDKMIAAFAEIGNKYVPANYDHILFSFHGLPARQLMKADPTGCHCQKTENCCESIVPANRFCYGAQSYATAQLIAKALNIPKEKYTICFQSRLGKEVWMQPYTSQVVKDLAEQGKKNVLVFCPAFVCDCLETVYEVSEEYQELFEEHGGHKLQLVDGLNDHPLWIESLEGLSKN